MTAQADPPRPRYPLLAISLLRAIIILTTTLPTGVYYIAQDQRRKRQSQRGWRRRPNARCMFFSPPGCGTLPTTNLVSQQQLRDVHVKVLTLCGDARLHNSSRQITVPIARVTRNNDTHCHPSCQFYHSESIIRAGRIGRECLYTLSVTGLLYSTTSSATLQLPPKRHCKTS
jgi:hypothetical protein